MKPNRLTCFIKQSLPYFEQLALHINASNISAHAGEAAFFIILSFFPFTMFLCSLVRLTPLTKKILIKAIQAVFPTSFHDYLGQLINEIYTHYSTAVLSLTIITAVWLGSKAFLSLIRGLNDMYQITESRNFIWVRILSVIYTAMFAILILVTITISALSFPACMIPCCPSSASVPLSVSWFCCYFSLSCICCCQTTRQIKIFLLPTRQIFCLSCQAE